MTSYPLLLTGRRCLLALFIVIVMVVVLPGCTPRLNWREIQVNPPGLSVLFPDKPAELSRSVALGEHRLIMHMTGARVDELRVTVTVGQIDAASGLTAALALERMEQAMLRNIEGKPQSRETGELAPGVAVLRLKAQGTAQAKPVSMWAWFFQRGSYVVQAVALGEAADEEPALSFLQSLKLRP